MKYKTLIIEDETPDELQECVDQISNCQAFVAETFEKAMELLQRHRGEFSIILLDIELPDEPNTLLHLSEFRKLQPDALIIIVTVHENDFEYRMRADQHDVFGFVRKNSKMSETVTSYLGFAVLFIESQQGLRDFTTAKTALLDSEYNDEFETDVLLRMDALFQANQLRFVFTEDYGDLAKRIKKSCEKAGISVEEMSDKAKEKVIGIRQSIVWAEKEAKPLRDLLDNDFPIAGESQLWVPLFSSGELIAAVSVTFVDLGYIPKPVWKLLEELCEQVTSILIVLQQKPDYPHSEHASEPLLVAKSERMLEVAGLIDFAASCDSNVLILGETGVGKGLFAKLIHRKSKRSNKKFVPINCGAISDKLFESELFGHEKGAFTGADNTHKGAFERADGGTLFLDEIGETPSDQQVKYLTAIDDKQVTRVGGDKEIPVDVRLIAATNRDLKTVNNREFRNDLLYRVKVLVIEIPPLRERTEEIPELCEFFAKKFSSKRKLFQFAPCAISLLKKHEWEGNVRELISVVEVCSIFLSKDETVVSAEFIARNVPSLKALADECSLYEEIAQQLMQASTDDDDLVQDLQSKLFGEILDVYEKLEKKTQGELHKQLGHKKLESFKSRIELLGYHRDHLGEGHKSVATRLMSDLELASSGDVVDLPCGINFSKKHPK